MIKGGTRPTRLKHTDYDFLKSHKFGGVAPSFPSEFLTDAGFGMPDQNAAGRPNGCTNFAQSELVNNLTKLPHNPEDLEAVTHANALGGYDIRDSLDAARKKLGWFSQYFNIRPSGIIDAFDAFRLAQISGLPEQRSLTIGFPWFPSWEMAMNGQVQNPDGSFTLTANRQSIMAMPTDAELSLVRKDPRIFSWHNSVFDGWTTKNGILLYRDKSFQGTLVGDNGFIYFPREVVNRVMAISGTVAYTPSNTPISNPLPIDLNAVQWIISLIRSLLHI